MVPNLPPDGSKLIDAYVAQLPLWQRSICELLRQLVHQADPDVVEDWKWNAPAFSHNGLVCWFWASKKWVTFTFFQGALINDTHKLFNYGHTNDRNRSIKLTEASQINGSVLLSYVKEAVVNNLAGRKIEAKPEPRRPIDLPHDIRERLRDAGLIDVYEMRPYYQQKGYLSWIENVKQELTRERRIARMLGELRTGVYMPPQNR